MNSKPFIILAEDNGGDTFLIQEALQQHNLTPQLKTVDNGESMILLIDEFDKEDSPACPDLILLDLNLPKRSGDEVLKHLRKSSRCPSTPVIVMTSSDSQEDRERATGLGVSAYFRKPSDLDGFMEIGLLIRQVLAGELLNSLTESLKRSYTL